MCSDWIDGISEILVPGLTVYGETTLLLFTIGGMLRKRGVSFVDWCGGKFCFVLRVCMISWRFTCFFVKRFCLYYLSFCSYLSSNVSCGFIQCNEEKEKKSQDSTSIF